MFATLTTGFHFATKPSLQLSIDEATTLYNLPSLHSAITTFLASEEMCLQVPQPHIDRLHIWHKVHVQQRSFHNSNILLLLQTLCAVPPSTAHTYRQYDSVIISLNLQSDWPKNGLAGHSVAQLQLIFCLPHLDLFLTYIHHFSLISQSNPASVSPATGMHLLRCVVRGDSGHISEVIPLICICSPAHIIPNFGHKAHSHLTLSSIYKLSNDFWLNKYWMKELYYTLSSVDWHFILYLLHSAGN